jgi:predicted transcriptional regulator
MPTDETPQFLAGSPDRREVLYYLLDSPAAPAELADELSLSRRSVQRHLSQFADRGWAEKDAGAYRLTMTGRLIAEEHRSYLAALDQIERHSGFFRFLPDGEHTPDPRWLADATVTTASADNPQAPVQHYLDSVRSFEADRIRMVAPVLSRLFHDAHAELAMEGARTELVMTESTIERARELNPAEFELVVSVGVLDLYRHADDIAVGLTIGSNRVLVGTYDDEGHLQACVESTNADCLAWARNLFDQYRDASTPVDPSFSLPFERRR